MNERTHEGTAVLNRWRTPLSSLRTVVQLEMFSCQFGRAFDLGVGNIPFETLNAYKMLTSPGVFAENEIARSIRFRLVTKGALMTNSRASKPICFILFLFLLTAFANSVLAATSGKLALPSYEPASGFVFQDAFPGIHFDDPVAIATPPGETNRLFVVERLGRIMVITNLAAPTKTVFLDLRRSITTTFFEDGLLGMAFHPNFASNGYFYVYRTFTTSSASAKYAFHDILARYSVSPDNPNAALINSEVRLITQLDSQVYHNAGTVAFGPDGYLYLSIGDDGPAGEDVVPIFAQNIDKGLFGTIIRIDVDKRPGNLPPNPHLSSSTNYFIPRDNPFIGATNFNGLAVNPSKVRTEIYAIGLRNPWRFTIHPVTGAVIAGDVGAATTEEVNEIVPGGNYGWPYFEGTDWVQASPPGFTYKAPTIKYHHGRATNEGNCVIGGSFYFGNKLPGLYGKYIFGDFRTGNIWAVPYDPVKGLQPEPHLQRLTASTEIVAFGPDPRDNELLAVNTLNGKILRLNYIPPEEAPYFPQTLAETGAFEDLKTLTPISDFIPYNVNVTFWSDNAIKNRWFLPPSEGGMTFAADGNWTFPSGMVWMKNFEMELEKGNPASRKRLETRFIVKNETGVYGVTYKWDPSGTNATLVPEEGLNEALTISEGGTNRLQTWRYPSRSECLLCHTELGGLAIGFNTPQLNCNIDYGKGAGVENQIEAFQNSGYFQNSNSIPDLETLRKFSRADEEEVPIYDRVRSFIGANCQFCHQPGTLNDRWDGRPATTLDKTGLILPYYHIIPRSPDSSVLVKRLTLRGVLQMPPVASNVQDATDLKLVRDWINGFPPAPWKNKDLSPIPHEGSAYFVDESIQAAGAGSGLSQSSDTLQYIYMPASNNITATVRLESQSSNLPGASSGILLRANDSSAASSAFLGLNYANRASLISKSNASATPAASGLSRTLYSWLQLRKEGDEVSAWAASDRGAWTKVGESEVPLGSQFYLGLASYSGNPYKVNLATFKEFSTISANLTLPLPGTTTIAQQPVYLSADVITKNTRVARVEFWSDSNKIGESTSAPFNFTWTGTTSGSHQITARAYDEVGNFTISPPVLLVVSAPPPKVRFEGVDDETDGDWIGKLGTLGYAIPGEATNIVFPVAFSIFDATTTPSNVTPNDHRILLQNTSGTSYSWTGNSLKLNVNSTDNNPYKLSLYFVSWDKLNLTQLVTIRDAATGQLLDNRIVSDFGDGLYLQWTVRGAVQIEITGNPAVLAGVLFDAVTNAPPVVQLLEPETGRTPLLPNPVVLGADASDSDGGISGVEFYVDDLKVGESTSHPYQILWTNALSGSHVIFARAIDDLGSATDSAKAIWTPRLPVASATLVNVDAETQGNWIGNYGSEGFLIVNHATNLPPTIGFSSSLNLSTTWAHPPMSETRALLTTNGTGRIASTFYSPYNFTIDLAARDGLPHKFSLYFLDWDRASWKLNVRVLTTTGVLLDERQISGFEEGQYYSWVAKGGLRLEFNCSVGFAVLGGIFVDPVAVPEGQISLIDPPANNAFPLGSGVLLKASVTHTSVPPSKVEFFVNGKTAGSSMVPPYYFRWLPDRTGSYELMARMQMANGSSIDSLPVSATITDPPPITPKAIFEQVDSTTSGSWRNKYGTEGFSIFLDNTLISDPLHLLHSGDQGYIWAAATQESRGLQNSTYNTRAATVWYADNSFELRAGSSDGLWHRLSLYCVDWDYGWREQRISILDPSDRSVLDTQVVSDFFNGKYLTWKILGDVVVKFESMAGEAVVSGIFYDPIAPVQQWQLSAFSSLEPGQAQLMNDEADPDNDGIPNLLEYKLGLDPLLNQSFPAFASLKTDGAVRLVLQSNPLASDVEIQFEASSDLIEWHPANGIDLYSIDPGQAEDSMEFQVNEPKQVEFFRLKAVRK